MIGVFEKNKIALNAVNCRLTSTSVPWQRFASFPSGYLVGNSNVLSVSKRIILYLKSIYSAKNGLGNRKIPVKLSCRQFHLKILHS